MGEFGEAGNLTPAAPTSPKLEGSPIKPSSFISLKFHVCFALSSGHCSKAIARRRVAEDGECPLPLNPFIAFRRFCQSASSRSL